QVGKRVGIVVFGSPDAHWPKVGDIESSAINLTNDPQTAAAQLYDSLHRIDRLKLDLILIEEPPNTPEWAAIRDRLKRAAAEG
ncbi:MAG TPA: Sua5 family C-terminal domain-containing protein, partial [Gemmata sp.]|nr:Sua5 family C-terminal domain-containing protein [Gemmata sp.]